MEKPNAKFKDRLSQALLTANMKAVELSSLSGIPKSSISQYLSGYAIPKTDRTYMIAKVLKVNPVWLMGYDVPMYENKQEPPQEEPTLDEQSLIKKYRLLSNREQAAVDNLINNLSQTEKTPAKIDYSRFKTAEEIMKEDHLIAKGGGKVNISKENLQKIIEKAKKDE